MRVYVTQAHIDKAYPSGETCPVACALTGLGFKDVYVSPDAVDFTTVTGSLITLSLPAEAQEFIEKYDGFQRVEPFSFELDADAYKDLL